MILIKDLSQEQIWTKVFEFEILEPKPDAVDLYI